MIACYGKNKILYDNNMLGTWTDTQIPNTYSHYADPVMETLLVKVLPKMQQETSLNLFELTDCKFNKKQENAKNNWKFHHINLESYDVRSSVNFISEQMLNNDETSIIKNKDTWTFEKPEKSTNPKWILTNT